MSCPLAVQNLYIKNFFHENQSMGDCKQDSSSVAESVLTDPFSLDFIIAQLHFLVVHSCCSPKSEVMLWWSEGSQKIQIYPLVEFLLCQEKISNHCNCNILPSGKGGITEITGFEECASMTNTPLPLTPIRSGPFPCFADIFPYLQKFSIALSSSKME